MKTWMIMAVIIPIDFCTDLAYSYETPTHSELSLNAIDVSILASDPEFLSEIGITGGLDGARFPSEVPVDEANPSPDETFYMFNAPIGRILAGGSVLEDRSTRSLHHFYDPINGGRGLSLEILGLSIPIGTPSPDWILEESVAGMELDIRDQAFSYRDTLTYFYQGLTESQQTVRDNRFGLMFRGLGHVIHHLQDMAQPQHVRNEQHCEKAINILCTVADNPSHFEKYTDLFRLSINSTTGTYPVPLFPVTRNFWENNMSSGLAEFTQHNFVGQGSNFELDSLGRFSGNRRYPHPVPFLDQQAASRDLQSVLLEANIDQDEINQIMQGLDCDRPLECVIDFIASNVAEVDGNIIVNDRAASFSLLDDELQRRDLRKGITPSYNRLNFHAAYPYLIPRAVAYSAGLINHFFRGRLRIEDILSADNGETTIKVRNVSIPDNDLQQGRFELYYDSTDGVRRPVGDIHIINQGLPVVVGGSLEFSMAVPADVDREIENPYTLIFNARQGRIGEEPGIAAIQFDIPLPGIVDRLTDGVGSCPDKVYAVRIVFPEQPEDHGQVLLQGNSSGAVFDFTGIPEGAGIIRAGALWSHHTDVFTDKYSYEVTYRYPASNTLPCDAPPLGHWVHGEQVRAVMADN